MTSMHDDPPLTELERLAGTVVARHRDGRCNACRPDGCPEVAWAAPVVRQTEARWLMAAR